MDKSTGPPDTLVQALQSREVLGPDQLKLCRNLNEASKAAKSVERVARIKAELRPVFLCRFQGEDFVNILHGIGSLVEELLG